MIREKRVLITGASGFLGRHVSRVFSGAGWRAVGLGHGEMTESEMKTCGLECFRSSDVNIDSISSFIREVGRPQLVFHGAGSASVSRSWDDPVVDFDRTVRTTAAVVEAVRRHAPEAVIVYPSSAAVYGNISHEAIGEGSDMLPMSPYGVHKLLAEQLLLNVFRISNLRIVIIRFFSIFGPGLMKQILWDICQKILADPNQIQLDGDGSEIRDFMFVEDAARLVLHLAENSTLAAPLIVNGGNGKSITVSEVAASVMRAIRRNGDNAKIHFTGIKRPGDPDCLLADVALLGKLGFISKYSFDEGVREFVRWISCDCRHRIFNSIPGLSE